MNTKSNPRQLAREAWLILITCLFNISTLCASVPPVSAATFHPAVASGPVSQFVYDNFNDNFTDPALWSIEIKDSGPIASETNQRLEITLTADSIGDDFAAWYLSACQLRGDYDIQVDYEVLTWPYANGVRIGLADDHVNMQRVSPGRQPYDYPEGEIYLTTFDTADHVVGITSTSDLSGKLKLVREGNTLSSYYFTDNAWTLDASYTDPAYSQETYFYIGSFSGNPAFAEQEVKIAFDNLIINTGELVCPTTPEPDLAITQVADHATVSTGDPVGFTVTITNNGNGSANNVTLTDTLPIYPELSWSVSGTDAASCTITEAIVSCNFGDMPPGEVKTIRLTSPTQYISGTGFCPIIISVADVMATNQPEERSASANTTVLCPYVYISVWSDTPDVTAGDPISFTISVGNTGDGIAKDVEAATGLPNKPGLSWSITNVTPASAAGNCNIDTTETYTEILCFFDQMAPLEEILITITSPTTLDSCGELRSAGYVMFSNGLDHKSKQATIVVNCPASPSPPLVTTQPQSQAVYVGDTVGFSTAASGDPAPGLQWQVSTDSGTSWTDIAEATTSPLTFTAALDQNGNQYRAVFTNSAGIATSDAAVLSVSKKPATVALADLTQTYDGQPKPVTVTTDPVGLSVVVTYNGLPTAPTAAGSYPVVATINDATYQGSLSGTLTIQKRVAYVTPYDAYKLYGTQDPVLMGFLVNFIEADGVTATYSRTPGEAVGSYTILGALNPNEKLVNYNITYHKRTLTINPRPVTVTADAKTKVAGESDPSLTYNITSGSLAFSDAFNGALIRDPGEEAGVYAIRQGTLALDSNYTLTYVGANLTILPASVNTAPIANPGGPYLGAINTAISFDGSLSSDADGDPLTYTWSFGDGGTAASAMPNHTYTAAGIYDTCLTVNDGTEDSEMVCTIAVVYDPSAGFVSGSGWIDSPAGAYLLDPSLAGRARFGFVSKYQKGATVPTGHTEFRIDAGRFNFHSETYEWLVVNTGGTNAQFKGSGLVNGALDPNGNAYKFMLWATDGATSGGPDTFRIRIWWDDAAGEHDVYDNCIDQAIGGGSIVVHTKK
jgi:uncharacterized repeat protein (TIGR01451 family)